MANEKVSNRLINEKSPYLLQHAHNPVNWYPWGSEVFDKAKSEDKPRSFDWVLLATNDYLPLVSCS